METPSSKAFLGPKEKEFCNEPLKTNDLPMGSISSELPTHTKDIDCPDHEPQKTDHNPETTLKKEHEPSFKTNDLPIGSTSELPNHTEDIDCLNQEPPKTDPNPETTLKKEHEPSFKTNLNYNKASKGEPSKPSPPPGRHSKRPIVCKFCSKKFSSTQALGGHQNAHKQEREMQKATKVAHDIRTNPYLYSLSRAMVPSFPEFYIGHEFQYHPYNGYGQRSFQAKPVYSHTGISPSQSASSLGQAMDRFNGSPGIGLSQGEHSLEQAINRINKSLGVRPAGTELNPGWPTPYAPHLGQSPTSFNGPTSFSRHGSSNSTTFMQEMENEGNLPKRQRVQSSGLDFSGKYTESAMMVLCPQREALPMMQNESTKLDLDLKL